MALLTLSPINARRWRNFKANRRALWSLWVFSVLFVMSLFAEFLAYDKPILVNYRGQYYAPKLRPTLSYYQHPKNGYRR